MANLQTRLNAKQRTQFVELAHKTLISEGFQVDPNAAEEELTRYVLQGEKNGCSAALYGEQSQKGGFHTFFKFDEPTDIGNRVSGKHNLWIHGNRIDLAIRELIAHISEMKVRIGCLKGHGWT
jgi:hypothetical protein